MPYTYAQLIVQSLDNISKGNEHLIKGADSFVTMTNASIAYQNNNEGKFVYRYTQS